MNQTISFNFKLFRFKELPLNPTGVKYLLVEGDVFSGYFLNMLSEFG